MLRQKTSSPPLKRKAKNIPIPEKIRIGMGMKGANYELQGLSGGATKESGTQKGI